MTEGESFRCLARSCWEISKVERHFLMVEPGFADSVISPAIFSASSVRIGDRRGSKISPVFDDCDLPKFISARSEESRQIGADAQRGEPAGRLDLVTGSLPNKTFCRSGPAARFAVPLFSNGDSNDSRHVSYLEAIACSRLLALVAGSRR